MTPADHDTPTHCENCHVALQGEFCHQCGQSIHSPVRHAGHAIEEVFESFWHLDGRLFRTLRDLLAPGRTTLEYLAGHRQRYLPPLRLFVIMSLLAFFVGKLTIHVDREPVSLSVDTSAITGSKTVEEVKRNRDRMLAEIEKSRNGDGNSIPGVDALQIAAQVQIEGEAANRITELTRGSAPPPAAGDAALGRRKPEGALFSKDNEVWDPARNPAKINWLPAFANEWLTGKLIQGRENIESMEGRPDKWVQALLSSLPSALFLLVPVFALMLKIAYVFKRRLYMEHLVVALYSHVFLLMALTAVFLLFALAAWVQPHVGWFAVCLYVAIAALLTWVPIYLLLMQKRVYAQGWPMTLLKYSVIGVSYFYLLVFAAVAMFMVTLVKA
ncbi:MAG TPA: DUF3667 domain-containing protein [Pseudoxanthomonas sp.]|nr:DUF3667 domain-containing protein [Pseudoxanthomonas sp.]